MYPRLQATDNHRIRAATFGGHSHCLEYTSTAYNFFCERWCHKNRTPIPVLGQPKNRSEDLHVKGNNGGDKAKVAVLWMDVDVKCGE